MQIDNNVLKPDENITLIFGGFSAHPTHFLPFFPKNSIILYHYTHLDFTPLLEILHPLQNCQITLIAFAMAQNTESTRNMEYRPNSLNSHLKHLI